MFRFITTCVIKYKLCFTRSLCLLGWRIPHQYGQTYPMKGLRREGETCCICLCQREGHNSWRVRSQAKKALRCSLSTIGLTWTVFLWDIMLVSCSLRWPMSVSQAGGAPLAWDTTSLRGTLRSSDFGRWTVVFGIVLWVLVRSYWGSVLTGRCWEQSQPGLGPGIACVDLVLWRLMQTAVFPSATDSTDNIKDI